MLRSVALLNFDTRRARRSLSVGCKSAHVTCKIQRSGRRYATWRIHISRVLNERCTAVLCAIAAQPSAAPQRRSIADRATAIYGVKRLPGEAACVCALRCGSAPASGTADVRRAEMRLPMSGLCSEDLRSASCMSICVHKRDLATFVSVTIWMCMCAQVLFRR